MRVLRLTMASAMCMLVWCGPAAAQNITQYPPDVAYDCFDNGQPAAACRIHCWDQQAAGGARDVGPGDRISSARNAERVEIFLPKAGGRWWMFVKRYNATNRIHTVDVYFFGPDVACKLGDVVSGDRPQDFSGWKMAVFSRGR